MAKRQHKIKIFLSIGKIPCFCQKNSKNPEKLIVFQGFYSGQHFYPLNVADDYERSQNSPFSKGVTMKGLVALYLYIIARKIADRKVFPYGRQLLFPGDCYALDYAYFEVEIQGISISHNHVFDDGTEYLSVVLVQTPHIT